jgi:hypothetical protein
MIAIKNTALDSLISSGIVNFTGWTSDPAGARTQDPILKRDVLYLLSY